MAVAATNMPDDVLICSGVEIFDARAVATTIDAMLRKCESPRDMRAAIVSQLAVAQQAGMDRIAKALTQTPLAARAALASYSFLTDSIVTEILRVATQVIHPVSNPTKSEKIAIIAVGGYGRAEMAPFSDVDLLFLRPYKGSAWCESVVETMLYILWDLRLKVGNATRNVNDCIRLGRQDYTIRTALLEARFVGGNKALADELSNRMWEDLFKNTGADFIEAKLKEREERHTKQGYQRYMVEPNIKEGKGGLRDLQSLFWIAKYLYRVASPRELVGLGIFSPAELDIFARAENFLWSVRNHMHLIAGRANENLTFDTQVEVADRLGYTDKDGRRAVEHFMQAYFMHATQVGRLTRIFLTDLEARHVKRQPSIGSFLSRATRRNRPRIPAGFKLVHGRLNIADEQEFIKDPLNLLRLFEEGLKNDHLIHPDAMRLVSANLHLVDEKMRNSAEANRIFLDLLLKHGNPERALRRMNEMMFLGTFIPEFQPIVAMMQFNMYHHFTVDEHTIQCISILNQIENNALVESLPIASGILAGGVNRKVLYVALLMHDIGKGRDEDHSILGARIAQKVCPRLGLSDEETDTVVWLVRHHLLMSDVAQKRDLSDPRTVHDFARTVGSRTRLKLLIVLTVCDIRGVGPGTWNNWKAQLLRDLYRSTRQVLKSGPDTTEQPERADEARDALCAILPDWDKMELLVELERHYDPYWLGLDTDTQAVFARLLKNADADAMASDLKLDPDRDATRVCFAMGDHPGIFSRLAGALALVGANVVDARSYTTSDGFATSVFWIQDVQRKPYDKSRLTRLRAMIEKTLRGEVVAREALKDRDKIRKRERDFIVPTDITFDNEGSEIYTIIEVDTRDRPGLLFDLTRAISSANIYIASAVIATYGVQAVDVFYVKDMFGLKLHTKTKRDSLEKRLRAAIKDGAQDARE